MTEKWTTTKPEGSNGWQYITRNGEQVAMAYGLDPDSEAKANAEFIVKACNAYEEMLSKAKPD